MKKSSIILGSVMLMGLTGYGAWCIYKKMCPESAEDMKDGIEHAVKKKEKKMNKIVEDMM